MKKTWHYGVLILLGALLVGGAVLLLIFPPTGLAPAGYIVLGLGCGLLGGGAGGLMSRRIAKKRPEQAAQIEIEQKDERNVAINNRAKAMAFSFGIMAYNAILLVFALLGIPVWAVLTLCGGNILTVGVYIFFLARYQKTM